VCFFFPSATPTHVTIKILISRRGAESGGSVPRLGIPELGSTECLRGYLSMFPQALTMSQAWNRTLVHAVAAATGDEVRASANEGSNGGSLSSGNAGGSLQALSTSPAIFSH
jgi:hypothetical protein